MVFLEACGYNYTVISVGKDSALIKLQNHLQLNPWFYSCVLYHNVYNSFVYNNVSLITFAFLTLFRFLFEERTQVS